MHPYIRLENERIILETMKYEDISKLWKDSISEEVWRFLPKRFESVEDLERIYRQSLINYERGVEHPFTVFDKVENEFVGSTRFMNISNEYRNLEIGWTWFIPKVWNTRVNTECKYLLLNYCFEELNMLRVGFKADSRNERSDRAIRRLGAQKEGVLRKFGIMQDGFIRDANMYSIIDSDWPQIKQRFENVLLK
ncbi:GNAT family N-acetyltransferase [Paenibacillus sp. strain BS8-2]